MARHLGPINNPHSSSIQSYLFMPTRRIFVKRGAGTALMFGAGITAKAAANCNDTCPPGSTDITRNN